MKYFIILGPDENPCILCSLPEKVRKRTEKLADENEERNREH